jgi:hypothetical protein
MAVHSAAEAQARLNISLKDIVSFFVEAEIEDHSIELLNNFIEKHQTAEFLDLAEGFGRCMAFLDHDELISRLYKSYSGLLEGYSIERKLLNKKIKFMKEDKKTDPEVLSRQESLLLDIDSKKAVITTSCARIKAMMSIPIATFRNEKFDFINHVKLLEKERKQNKEKK